MKQTPVQTPSKNAGHQEWDIYCQTKQEEEHREFEQLKAENRKFKIDNEKLQAKLTKAHERIEQIRKTTTRQLNFLRSKLRYGFQYYTETLNVLAPNFSIKSDPLKLVGTF